ncbi:hypothetical protein JCM8097_002709 [Rhodosporidiobolus ruineniae]
MAGDDFEKQAAAMAAPPPKKWVPSARSFIYAVLLFLTFACATAQMGLWSWALQTYGNNKKVFNYPSAEVMMTGNELFFNGILTMLVALGAPFLPILFQSFLWFAIWVMDCVSASILTYHMPFTASSCSVSPDSTWLRFVPDCKKWVAFEAMSWTVFALAFVLFVMTLVDFIQGKKREGGRHYLLGA